MDNRIREMHVGLRPYERLEHSGAAALSDAELIAILIRSGSNGTSAIRVASEILSLDRSGEGVSFLKDLTLEELQGCKGMGRVKALIIKSALELGKRSMMTHPFWENTQIKSPDDAIHLFEYRMSDLKREEVHVALLDTRHRVMRHVVVSSGGLASTGVFPRELFREAIKSNASAIILAHNHPSGDPKPSQDDITTTQSLFKAASLIGIDLIDHIIVGRGGCTSMKQSGLI
ncbi:MAG: DNA repair protein RadC [Clostridiales bacterium]|nr:DNA repair protein RadC [Clostridiales bacterium]